MSLDIGAALREGFDRTTSRPALVLAVVFFVVGLASTVLSQTLLVAFVDAVVELARQQGQPPGFDPAEVTGQAPFALPVPIPVAAGLALVLALVSEAVSIVAVRTFVADAAAGFPEGLGRRLGIATLNGFVGGIVVFVFTFGGLFLLIVPGVFFYLSFLFLRQVIAAEDANFVTAMTRSWALSKGNRIELLGLVVILVVVTFAASIPSFALDQVSIVLGSVVGLVVSAVVGVFTVATVSRAYVQLREEDEAVAETGGNGDGDPYDAPLGPDDLPEP
jgi:hypothetical protein